VRDDSELQELFTDPSDEEILDLLKAARPAAPPIDPNFRSYLRAKLMTEAQRTLPRTASRGWLGLGFRPRTMAFSMAAVAAGFLVVLGAQVYLRGASVSGGPPVAFNGANVANKTDVAAATQPIELQFSGPVDKQAVAESVVIEPATSVTKQWVGSTLVIIPTHPLAPNTSYSVKLQPAAAAPTPIRSVKPGPTPAPTAAPTPVVVHFSTVRAPIPPVVPPSFKSTNVTYGHDSRVGDSGTILDGTWTAGGQILATRPRTVAPAASATPSATGAPGSSSSNAASGTDVWLLNADGTPVRVVAPGATFPAAPPSGNLMAAWTMASGQARLDVHDLQGNLISTVATLSTTPSRAPTWVGTDRLAYVDGGVLKVVDLHGVQLPLPAISVSGDLEASPSGTLLAVESQAGSLVLDLSQSPVGSTPLPTGATGFDWSAKGDLAFVVQQSALTDVYVAADGKHASRIASSPAGQTWSDLNWSPDAASILLATRRADGTGSSTLLLINRDGSAVTRFGATQLEYRAPEWSPSGDDVLFTRRDDATGGITFWVATASTNGGNGAEQQALSEVDHFMQARLQGDAPTAQGELDSNGQAAYQAPGAMLTSPQGMKFSRYYPVTVQVLSSTPSRFLIGVRIFLARPDGTETGYFEEQLTVLQQGQRYIIDDAKGSSVQPLSHGPTVLSVQVLGGPSFQQVRVQFDADLAAATVSAGTIEIKDQAGDVVTTQVSFDPDHHLATLTAHLRPGTYQLAVTTAVTDINGTPLSQEFDAPLVISR
jgi:Bacterial Ig-like domain